MLVALSILLSGCTFNQGRTPVLSSASIPGAEQSAISAHERILQSYGGVYKDEALSAYVKSVIERLGRHEDLSERTYALTVLNSPLANAMALSDGRIYLTRGMLAHLNDEAELAAVLAHEMAHVSAQHIASRRDVASDIALLDSLVGDLVGWEDRAGLLSRSGLLAGYSRLQENDADRLAVIYLEAAGYDPLAVSDVLAAMNAYSKYRASQIGAALWVSSSNWLANHPDPEDRAQKTAERALALRLSDQPKQRGRARYMAAIDGLLYGMPSDQGFVRGQRFVHPIEEFRFQVPDTFRLYNAGDVVWALGPDKVIVKFDRLSEETQTAPLDYLTNDWAGSLALRDVQSFEVNGLSGASAWMRFQGLNTYAAVIMRPSTQIYRFLIGVPPQVGDQYNDDIQDIVASFGLINEGAMRAGPRKIRVLQTSEAERLKDIAARLRISPEMEAEFFLINGRSESELVPAGTLLKVIDEDLVR